MKQYNLPNPNHTLTLKDEPGILTSNLFVSDLNIPIKGNHPETRSQRKEYIFRIVFDFFQELGINPELFPYRVDGQYLDLKGRKVDVSFYFNETSLSFSKSLTILVNGERSNIRTLRKLYSK